jgi:hypothetical protein
MINCHSGQLTSNPRAKKPRTHSPHKGPYTCANLASTSHTRACARARARARAHTPTPTPTPTPTHTRTYHTHSTREVRGGTTTPGVSFR